MKAGFELSTDDQEAMLIAWRTSAWLLGLAPDLEPADMREARWLHDTILARHQRGTAEGAVVIRELLHVMEGLLPPGARRVPAALMRYQLGDRVAELLDVPRRP